MAILGPSITVACQTPFCPNHGVEVRVRSEVTGGGKLLAWSNLTCAECGCEPKIVRRD